MSLRLHREGHDVGRDMARGLMAAVRWRTVYPRPRASRPEPGRRLHPYLLGGLERIAPGEVTCADITCIPVRNGFPYLVAMMHWASRFVLPWELDNTLQEALAGRTPAEVYFAERAMRTLEAVA